VQRVIKKFYDLKSARLTTRVLLALFLALVVCVVFVGLDNPTGIIIGWAAVTVLLAMVVRKWHKIRNFLILLLVAVVGAIFLSLIYMEVALPLAEWFGGPDATQSVPWRIFHVIISNLILLFTPPGIFIGLTGSIWLGIARLSSLRKRERTRAT
jgi:multisubunit Na+/H+ antiporter MnhB subunit